MTNQEGLSSNCADYASLLQLFELCVNRYQENAFIRYILPNNFEFRTLTYSQVDAISTCLANIWRPLLPISTKHKDSNTLKRPCVAVLSDSPVQAALTFFATLKLGLIYFPLSIHNSEEANIHLLKNSNTCFLITSDANREKAITCTNALRDSDEINIQIYDQFDVDKLLSEPTAVSLSVQSPDISNDDDYGNKNSSFDTTNNRSHAKANPLDTIAYMHTTGSTGLPKLTPWNTQMSMYGILGGIVNLNPFPSASGDSVSESTNIMPTDVLLYPVLSITVTELVFLIPMMLAGASILLFDHKLPTFSELISAIEMFSVTFMINVPVGLELLAEYLKKLDDVALEHSTKILQSMKLCLFYGAQLPVPTGDYLKSKGFNVQTLYGCTEMGPISTSKLSKDNMRWYEMTLTSQMMKYATFEPYEGDLYHLVIHSDFPSLAKGVGNRPNGDYATKDLFVKNVQEPSGAISWTLVGRMDDMINTSLGDLVIPGPIEEEILKEDIILQCTIVGNGRESVSVLVELDLNKATQYSPVQMVSKVYEAINQANKFALSYAMIKAPNMVYILPFNKQLPKTRKGTVKRKEAIVLFEQEIDQMYEVSSFEEVMN